MFILLRNKENDMSYMIINGNDSVIISGKVIYDAYGRAIQSGHPTTEPLGNMTNYTPIQLIYPTTTTYDVLDRPLKQIAPDNTEVNYAYSIANDPFGKICYKTEITDPNNNKTTEFKDARGLQTAIISPLQFTTKFTYSALGQLLTSIDPEDNITTYQYDMLGRLIQRLHPDAGQTIMEYDNAGNLIAKQNQNQVDEGVVVEYDYDFNRLIGIRYPNNPAQNVKYQYGAPNTGNQSGRLILQEDASGVQEFFYGNLGELTKNVRTFVMPNSNPLTFAMEFNYDSWNRITQMIYPDGERVHYQYDNGGQLKTVFGTKQTDNGQEDYVYVKDIKYDEYGSRSEILYGNGIQTTYTYEPLRRRLTQLQGIDTNTGEIVQNVEYDYDAADNIKEVIKSADRGVNGLSYTHSMYYEYDDMYRLIGASHGASGGFSCSSGNYASLEGYSLTYSPSGNITSKSVAASILTPGGNVGVYYNNTYNYNGRPHTVSYIYGQELEFEWDGSGNMTRQFDYRTETQRRMRWDEENRLKAVYDSEQRLSSYLYDAGGERTLKMSGSYQSTYINSSLTISSVNMTDYTLYTSPYMVMTDNEYTKHYYVEADRVASKIGGGMANNITGINDVVIGFEMQSEENYLQKNNDVLDMMTNDFNELEVHASIEVYTNTVFWEDEALGQNGSEADLIYFFHKDHLGSSTQISDISANIIHHVEYMPYGETFVEQRSNWGTNYKFNGKELDEETGYYYYGARYYNQDISIWLSIDPLSDKYPSMSPYMYCAGNPVILVDPDGREWRITSKKENGKTEKHTYKPGESYLGNNEFIRKTVDNLNMIHATDEGKGKIERLAGKGFLVNIKEADGVGKNSYKRRSYTGFFNYAEIYASAIGGVSGDGVFMDALEGLAHEVQHAFDDFFGTEYNEKNWEMNAVKFQNYITSVYSRGSMRTKYGNLFSGLSGDETAYNSRLEKITNFKNIPIYLIPPQVIVTGSNDSDRLKSVNIAPGIIQSMKPVFDKTYGR